MSGFPFAKSSDQSTANRQTGNEHYSLNRVPEALAAYNRAIQLAQHNSEPLALALANRLESQIESMAAVHLHCARFGAAKSDMQLAMAIRALHPSLAKHDKKWQQRYEECSIGLRNQPQTTSTEACQPLAAGANSRVAGLSAALNTTWTESKGRCLTLTQPVAAGSLLVTEPPISWHLQPEHSADFCQTCCTELQLDAWLPCARCTRNNVRYCTVGCRDSAWTGFHRFECGQTTGYHADDRPNQTGNMELLAQRLLTRLSQTQPDFANDFVTLFSSDDLNNNNCNNNSNSKNNNNDSFIQTKGIRFGVETGDNYGQNLRSVMSLMKRQVPDECQIDPDTFAVKSSLATDEFLALPFWPTAWDRARRLQTGCRALNELYARVALNAHGIEQLHGASARPVDIGTALYISTALTNHACLPNAARTYVHGRIQCRALRRIDKGEELTISYGPRFGRERRAERQHQLLLHYGFACDCAACTRQELVDLEHRLDAYVCAECGKPTARCTDDGQTIKCFACETVQTYTSGSVHTMISETLRDMDISLKQHAMDVTDVPARIKSVSSVMSKVSDQYLLLYGAAAYICFPEDPVVAEQLINVVLKSCKPLSCRVHTDRILWLYKVAMKVLCSVEPGSTRLASLYRTWLLDCLCFYGIDVTKKQLAKMDTPDLVDDLVVELDELLSSLGVANRPTEELRIKVDEQPRLRASSWASRQAAARLQQQSSPLAVPNPSSNPTGINPAMGSSPLSPAKNTTMTPPIGSPLSLMIPEQPNVSPDSWRGSCTPPELLSPPLVSPPMPVH